MRRFVRALLAGVLLSGLLVFAGGVTTPAPAQAAGAITLNGLKARAIYYQQAGKTAQRDLAVASMANYSSRENRLWSDFVATWSSINEHMTMNYTVPTDLPTTAGHVFVVLGAAPKKSGKPGAKLERRLKLALKALKKYPESDVLISGGESRKGFTEAGVGRKWLRANGVAGDRILVEKKAASTIGNAVNSLTILQAAGSYSSYTLITDSSHMRRASILFEAAEVLVQERTGQAWEIERVSNLAFPDMPEAGKVPLSASSVSYSASNVAYLFAVLSQYSSLVADPPDKAELTSISLKPPSTTNYSVGDNLDTAGMVVSAVYDKGAYTAVVTKKASVSGFTASRVGEGTATVSYTDGGVTRKASFDYSVARAGSSVALSTPAKKIASSRRAVVTASITGNKVAATGKVTFRLDGDKVAARTLVAADEGVVTLKLPKIAARGRHDVTVVYAGDSRLKASRSSLVLKVTG